MYKTPMIHLNNLSWTQSYQPNLDHGMLIINAYQTLAGKDKIDIYHVNQVGIYIITHIYTYELKLRLSSLNS